MCTIDYGHCCGLLLPTAAIPLSSQLVYTLRSSVYMYALIDFITAFYETDEGLATVVTTLKKMATPFPNHQHYSSGRGGVS